MAACERSSPQISCENSNRSRATHLSDHKCHNRVCVCVCVLAQMNLKCEKKKKKKTHTDGGLSRTHFLTRRGSLVFSTTDAALLKTDGGKLVRLYFSKGLRFYFFEVSCAVISVTDTCCRYSVIRRKEREKKKPS